MRISPMLAVSAGMAVAAMLVPAAASAATASSATGYTTAIHRSTGDAAPTDPSATSGTTPANAPATAAGPAASSGGDPDTTITFAVTTGLLTMTAPGTLALSSDVPGGTASGTLTPNAVTDNRGADPASWTATVLETDFTAANNATGPVYTIPASDASYTPLNETSSSNIVLTPTTVAALSSTVPATDMAALGTGSNTASWDATIAVAIPATAVAATASYSGTMVQSVS